MGESDLSSKLKGRLKEGKYINKSLFFLTHIISLKSQGKKYFNYLRIILKIN